MRNFLIFDNYFKNYRSGQNEIIEIQGVPFEIIRSTVWLNDKYEEIPEDQANDTSKYDQSLEQENVRIYIEDKSVIVRTPKIKAINTVTNEEERVYRDVRTGINVDTPERMMKRLVSKLTNSQNTQPTPPPNSVFGPGLGTINLGPSISDTNPNRTPLGDRTE